MSTLNPIKHIPNTITLGNLFVGCLAIVAAFEGDLLLSGYLILLASVLDYLDGFSARLLKAYSPLGKELDSLSDLVSFGVAPSVIMFKLLKQALQIPVDEGFSSGHAILVIPFIMAAFSSLRLGIFNLDSRQITSFIGLPTPANALFTVGLVLGLNSPFGRFFLQVVSSSSVLIAIVLVQSALLVSPVPMFSLKIKSFNIRETWKQQLLIVLALLTIFALGKAALAPVILIYVLISIITWPFKRD
jgi:CDP-diacylglycerol--serine O-phosphatidyltransferase